MVAPAGPVRAEALKFTLVKPLVGPCTTTWVSTVSPRALDKAITAAVPAAPLFPTLVMLSDTQTGKAAPTGWTPVPVAVTTVGEFVALLSTVTLPAKLPAITGAKVMFSVVD